MPQSNSMHGHIKEILYTEEQIEDKVAQLGKALNRDFAGRNPIVICVLKGAFIFMADIVKHLDFPMEVDFMVVSSYGQSTESSGIVKIVKDLDVSVENREVLIVEDIIDSGLTLSYLIDVLQRRKAKNVTIVTMFDKPARRTVDLQVDYTGFHLPDEFVVGYGLDYAEKYRNLSYIGILKEEIYNE